MNSALPPNPACAAVEPRDALLERIWSNPLLPSPPTLALQIVEKSRQANCTVQEIGTLLSQDPALCGKVLKTLNSSLYALSQPVTSLGRAVTILGLKPLRSLVLGLTLPAIQSRMTADEGLRNYWKESVAGAITARELAKRLGYPDPEDELVSSLLRDLGMILLRQTFAADYDPVWKGEVPAGRQCAWEEQHFGIHHAEVSSALLADWGLPLEIVEPIRYHHQPHLLAPDQEPVAKRAHLLDFTSRLAQLEDRRNPGQFQEILQTARNRFGLERADLEEFLGTVGGKIEEFATVLRVDIGACPNFAEVLALGCEELIRLSAEAAAEQTHRRQAGPTKEAIVEDGQAQQTQEGGLDTVCSHGRKSAAARGLFERLEKLGSGARIHHYVVEDFLGRGAMGIVLKALDPGLNRHVALKILAPELADCTEAHQRFALEARYAAAIRHENVVTIFAVSEVDGVPFLVMEYVSGTSLQDRLDAGESFTVSEIICIARQTALGLAAAHEIRLIHRDIKPANILLEQSTQRVRLTDFGLARALDHDPKLSQSGTLTGTPLYMSPEQVDGKPLTTASDLFSLGSVLYTLCAGQLPFRAESMSGLLHAVAEKTPAPLRSINPAVPEWLSLLIEKLHAKEPADRLPSAAAVAECCACHAADSPPSL
jgi:HD-like signal output (HDOD) protein